MRFAARPSRRSCLTFAGAALAVSAAACCGWGEPESARADEPAPVAAPAAGWKAGLARAAITPETAVWLAGYGSKRPPDGKLHDLWIKALALEDPAGRRVVLLTSDFQGVPKSMSDRVFARLRERYGLERADVMFTFSHNHCGPRLGDDLQDYYPVEPAQEALVAEYTAAMIERTVALVGDALADLAPATLSHGTGRCTFAVNRRNNREADVPAIRARGEPLQGPVDHAVPVLRVAGSDGGLRAVVFGYACHPTTLSFLTWCGDYPGFAQLELERSHPGALALFVNTCGGDQNPLPRRTVALCAQYGHELAAAVEETLRQPLAPVSPGLRTAFALEPLPYEEVVSRDALHACLQDPSPIKARWAARMLGKLDRGESFEAAYPYPLHAWRLGDELLLVGMGAETVVDYALRFKREFGPGTWVLGYTDDMIAYIPSRRVWEEGGYEGGSNLYEYGRPALRWSGQIEERIAATVRRLAAEVGAAPRAAGPPAGAGATQPMPDWVLETPRAAWQARDSQAEFAYRDRLWIVGGWFNSLEPPPRDVWSSVDGRAWERVAAEIPYRHTDLAMSLVFRDAMWLLGGWTDGRLPTHSATSAVWSSTDGAAWTERTAAAGWSPRLAAGAAVFRDRMWILGGTENYYFGDARSLKHDVWSSADGRTWRQETAAAPWSPRAYHQAVALGDRLYVLGGGNYVPEAEARHDVWSSEDGRTWRCETEAAPWAPRLWFAATAYRGRLWVLGGWSKETDNLGDVWHSADGRHWERLETGACWKARHEHSALVLRDKLWVAGGHARPLSSEVWSLELPADFGAPGR